MSTPAPVTAAIAAAALVVGGIAGATLTAAATTTPPSLAELQAQAHALADGLDALAGSQVTPTPTGSPSPTDLPSVTPSPSVTAPSPTPTVTSSTPSPQVTAPSSSTTPSGSIGSPTWPAPALTNPITLTYPSGSRGFTGSASLDPAKDYIIRIPSAGVVNGAGLAITGGRNVVVDGGFIDVGAGVAGVKRAGVLQVPGHLWIRNLTVTSSTGALTEGFNIYNGSGFGIPDTVTLQGIAFPVPVTGTQATNHADVIQAWAGPRVLNIDGLTASTTYQGFFLLPTQHQSTVTPTGYDLRNVTITAPKGAGYLLWRDGGTYPIRTSNVRVCGSNITNGGLWPNAGAWPGVTTTC